MRRFLSVVPVVVIISFLVVGGCSNGGDDGECPYDVMSIVNSENVLDNQSSWLCNDSADEEFTVEFFANGTGLDSRFNSFEWESSGCRSVIVDGEVFAELTSLEGSVEEGFLSFKERIDQGEKHDVNCVLELID